MRCINLHTAILVIAIILLLASCRKYEYGRDVHIYSGHIYRISDSTPYANTPFMLKNERTFSPFAGKGDVQKIDIITDENGYFEVMLRELRAGDFSLCKPTNEFSCLIEYIPTQREASGNISFGNIYIR